MYLHIDSWKFTKKPTSEDIKGIKKRFTMSNSIQNITTKQLADILTAGRTVQPGCTPFSEESKALGKTGTCKDDWKAQQVFMVDIDNELVGIPLETPEHAAATLADYGLPLAFAYPSFSSTAKLPRFRIVLVCDEVITDRAERMAIQRALFSLFPQADTGCKNEDRIFFGTNQGLCEGVGDMDAVCSKADLMALSVSMGTDRDDNSKPHLTKFGETIPTGQRHETLVNYAADVLTKYGNDSEYAYNLYMQRVGQCEAPKPESEIKAIWRDACKYYENVTSKRPGYIPPSEYAAQDFEGSFEPDDYTDVGQANVFTAVYGDTAKYTPATKWIVYDGKVWQESEIKAQGLSQELTENQLKEARKRVRNAQAIYNKAAESGDETKINEAKAALKREEAFRSFVLARRKTERVKATLTEARPKVEIDVAALDADPHLLNTPAGTVDLKTGKIRPHDPNDYCTKITAVAPGDEGADLFNDFIQRVTCNDSNLARYLQEAAGMCAVGQVKVENLLIAYGEGGNGKSTLFNLLARVMGDYAGALSAETLTSQCRKNKGPEYAELRGKRIVIAAELEEGVRLDTAIVKKLCSTDPVYAEKKYKDPFMFAPSHTVILYTNHLPKIGTIDKGTWSRLVVIPFKAEFRGQKGEIKNYADYLFDKAGGAVLSWIIEGAKRFITNSYKIDPPECVKEASQKYREENDWLSAFLSECCTDVPGYTQKAGDLYEGYRKYCDKVGEYKRSSGDLWAALEGAGYSHKRTKDGAFVYGLFLIPEDFQNISKEIPNDDCNPKSPNYIVPLTGDTAV